MLFALRRVQSMETYVFGSKNNVFTISTVLNTYQKKPNVLLWRLCAVTIDTFHTVILILLIRYVITSPPR